MKETNKRWECFKCKREYIEKPEDKTSDQLNDYLRYAGLCSEKCLQSYPVNRQHQLSVKFLMEGEGMKLKHNGVNVV